MSITGERIKELRKRLKLTQKEFSSRILVTPSYLSRVETGSEKPADMLIKLISLEFKVPISWLNGSNEDPYGQLKALDVVYGNGDSELIAIRTNLLNSLNFLLNKADSNVININISNMVIALIQILNIQNDVIEPKHILTVDYLSDFMTNIFNVVKDFEEIHSKDKLESKFPLLKEDYDIGSNIFFNKLYSLCKNEFDDTTTFETILDREYVNLNMNGLRALSRKAIIDIDPIINKYE